MIPKLNVFRQSVIPNLDIFAKGIMLLTKSLILLSIMKTIEIIVEISHNYILLSLNLIKNNAIHDNDPM